MAKKWIDWTFILLVAGVLVQLPTSIAVVASWASSDGPNLTVSGSSGPYEPIEPPTDPKLQDMVWFARLKIGNNGNQAATKLAIQWDVNGFVSVVDVDGNKRALDPLKKRISLGELPIGAEYEVRIWTDEVYSKDGGKQPLLVHDSGSELIFNRQESSWWFQLTFYWVLFLVVVGGLVVALGMGLGGARLVVYVLERRFPLNTEKAPTLSQNGSEDNCQPATQQVDTEIK